MFLRESLFSSFINPCIYYNKLKSLEVKIKILTMTSLYINHTSPLVNDVLHPSNEFTMYLCSDDVILSYQVICYDITCTVVPLSVLKQKMTSLSILISLFWQAKIESIRILQNLKSLLCIKNDTLPMPTIVF